MRTRDKSGTDGNLQGLFYRTDLLHIFIQQILQAQGSKTIVTLIF